MIVASVLGVPLVMAIGVLVFLGAFVPMIGATVAGTVAVLVALVDQGPVTALLMLGGVILVQQIEGHVLQPFLMGRFVSVHPLGVIIAIGVGVVVAGIPGALVAVPLAATVNAVAQHLAANTRPGDDPEEELERDYAADGEEPPPPVEDTPPPEPEDRDASARQPTVRPIHRRETALPGPQERQVRHRIGGELEFAAPGGRGFTLPGSVDLAVRANAMVCPRR